MTKKKNKKIEVATTDHDPDTRVEQIIEKHNAEMEDLLGSETPPTELPTVISDEGGHSGVQETDGGRESGDSEPTVTRRNPRLLGRHPVTKVEVYL